MEGKDCHRTHLAYAGKRKSYYYYYFNSAGRGVDAQRLSVLLLLAKAAGSNARWLLKLLGI